jgi:TonB family protein
MHQVPLNFDAATSARPKRLPVPPPRLLIAWTPFWPQLFANLCDIWRRPEPLPFADTSAPGEYWQDVFVHRPIPWKHFAQSLVFNLGLIAFAIATGKIWFMPTGVRLQDPVESSEVLHYKLDEFLPEIKTPAPATRTRVASKGDPEFARQRIVSTPPRADNSEQTIANPKFPETIPYTVPLPNLAVASPATKPKLEVPVDLPFILPKRPEMRAESTRLAKLPDIPQTQVLEPPAPDVARKFSPLDLPITAAEAIDAPQLTHDLLSSRKLDVPTVDIAEAPASAGTSPLRNLDVPSVQPLAPPSAAASVDMSTREAAGELLALNVRPMAPPSDLKVPAGSRSGVFAATPEGRVGAAGVPQVEVGVAPSSNAGSSSGGGSIGFGESGETTRSTVPSGISVSGGNPPRPAGAIVAERSLPSTTAERNTVAANRVPASAFDIPKKLPPPSYPPAEEKHPEDAAVFGDRRVYAMQINLPNLTSAGGSWIIRLAERAEIPRPGVLSTPVALSKVDPAYPADMMKDRIEGIVTLYAIIHADGSVGEIRLLHGFNERLNENAKIALSRWKFRPATKNGEPVEMEAVVQIPFKARRITF